MPRRLIVDEIVNVTVNDRGVFLFRGNRMNIRQVRRMIDGCQGQIDYYRREIGRYQSTIASFEKTMEKHKVLLAELTSPVVQKYIADVEEEKRRIEEKAQALLKEVVGDEAYRVLQRKGHFKFDTDGRTFQIYRSGKVYEKKGDSWKDFCIIKPDDLPLPDYVAAVFLNVKNRAKELHRR